MYDGNQAALFYELEQDEYEYVFALDERALGPLDQDLLKPGLYELKYYAKTFCQRSNPVFIRVTVEQEAQETEAVDEQDDIFK